MTTIKDPAIGDLLRYLSPRLARKRSAPSWPPDAFALAASLLFQSGAYLQVVSRWPPTGTEEDGCIAFSTREWVKRITEIGRRWRQSWPRRNPPAEVRRWWRIVQESSEAPLASIRSTERLCGALIQLCAAADEACVSVGFPAESGIDLFNFEAELLLLSNPDQGSTLCREVHPSTVRVLPKGHTPQNGISLRSLSHNLALWPSGDVKPWWYMSLLQNRQDLSKRHDLNLLLVPWPKVVHPTQFASVESPSSPLPDPFGFFTFRKTSRPEEIVGRVQRLYDRAQETVGRIDGVIFPELALDPAELEKLSQWARERQVLLVCGVGESGSEQGPGANYVALEIPFSDTRAVRIKQSKHHRWRLDKPQILQYGLAGQLNPERFWWEHMTAEGRSIHFVALLPWLSLCVLVCEDLARQEPVAKLVRAVGPNLVIALLMDAPQIPSRWPGQYATVLADDPGSSVLTLTSIGMAELSRPPGVKLSRSVALWKDAKSGSAREIELPTQAEGIVLNLVRQLDQEWTADGRSDERTASYPILGGVHPIFPD